MISTDMDGRVTDSSSATSSSSSDALQQRSLLEADRVYFVPYRWWKEGQDAASQGEEQENGRISEGLNGGGGGGGGGGCIVYASSPTSSGPIKMITNFFASDVVFNLKQREELSNGREDRGQGEISGRDYALLTEEMWLQTLKWNSEFKLASQSNGILSVIEDEKLEVYPLRLRLSVNRDNNQLMARISKKDNKPEFFKRACKIFTVDSEPVNIWDLSRQTKLFFVDEKANRTEDLQRHQDQEILLELQVYRVSDSVKSKDGKKEDNQMSLTTSSTYGSFSNGSASFAECNGSTLYFEGSGHLGLTGLQNLGNTCFMNSALQCLAHTPKLVEYFLGDYGKEINWLNPLGMDGELAVAFGDLLRKLWAPGRTPVVPQVFKSKLARFAPQFSGFNQHDSQELLAFLLDGLHEDLNRVKSKPYIEAKEKPGQPDEEVAKEYWENHLARNNSVIVDVCQGQYKSTLVCPVCNKVSITYDPFMYLSLPLPTTSTRTMTVTVLSTDGSSSPTPYTVSVAKSGKCNDLIQAVSVACSLRNDESLLVAEIYSHKIIRFLEEPSDSLSLIRDDDKLLAYRVLKDFEEHPMVVFMHQRKERIYGWKPFGMPLISSISGVANGSDLRVRFRSLLAPLLRPRESNDLNDKGDAMCENDVETHDVFGTNSDTPTNKSDNDLAIQFQLTDEKGLSKGNNLEMATPIETLERLHVLVYWPEELLQEYDINHLTTLPEVHKSQFFIRRPQEAISLYACLEAFLKEEPLGPEDMWYCPGCKEHRQASKKLDLWRLPEVLVIHLKRFSYSRFTKHKLEAFVDFPIDDLDLSNYISCKHDLSYNYKLYAMSNHYGNMGGGHYTAYVHHIGEDRWYDFDDSHVSPLPEGKLKSSAAYVLFYRRIEIDDSIMDESGS